MSIELSPLPYRLEAIAHTHLARRDSLKFLTTGPARFRLRNVAGGISITLADSSHSDGAFENAREASSNNVESIRAEQLGEDVLVSVRLRESPGSDLDIRSTQDYDASRDLHRFTVELVPPGGNAATLAASSGALARVRHSEVFGCALDFDRSMREQLDPQALSRALAPTSDFVDAHLRLALVRLGELSPDGLIALVDGARFRPANPLDLAAASAQSAEAIGFLSLLRAFVEQLEPIEQRRSALRGVVAPELDSERFDTLFEIAEALEDRCEEKTRSAGS